MGRNPKIKLQIKTEKQLNNIVNCSICHNKEKYRNMFFCVDESNYSITKNAKPVCKNCTNDS
jgi:hypothetical protein